jgi:nicotinamide-nucleotide adenylyltransferase
MKPLQKTGLFIGRFQPFHLGHLDIVKQILKKNDQIILAIGSAEKNYVPENPLTAGERVLVIDETLKAEGIAPSKYTIIPVRNINNYALWVDHLNLYVPPYDNIYTGSTIVKACYEGAQSKHKLVKIKRKRPISATKIRTSMLEETDKWKSFVPPRTAELLTKMKIPRRLRHIQKTMTDTKYK